MAALRVPPEVRIGRNKLAATVVVAHAFKHIYNSGLQAIVLPEIKRGLDLTATQFGSLAFARQATGWVVTIIAGYLGDRYPNRASLILAVSLSLMGISFFLAGRAPSYWPMFLAMLFVGLGPSLFHPPAIGALSRRYPDRRGFAIALHGTGGSVGSVLGPLVAAGILGILMWRDVLQASALPAILAGIVLWSMMRGVSGEETGTKSARAYFTSLASLLKNGALVVLVLVTALRSIGETAVMTFLPVYLREDLELTATWVAIYLSMSQIVGIGAQPAMGLISDKLGRKPVLIPAMLALGLLYIALSYADVGPQLLLTVLVMGAFQYPLHAIFIAAAMDFASGDVQSTMASLIYGASFLGTLSPVLAGVIADAYGIPTTFLFSSGITLLATFMLATLKMPRTVTQSAKDGV